jgi:signal transduction histidine kinase
MYFSVLRLNLQQSLFTKQIEMRLFFRKDFLTIFLPIFFFLFLLIGSASYYVFTEQKKNILGNTSESYSDDLFQRATMIRSRLATSVNDLSFLSRYRSVVNYFDDPATESLLIADLKLFGQKNWDYKQLCFIDADGIETIRIDWRRNQLDVVMDSLLQDRSDGPDFIKASRLKRGEIYISRLELAAEPLNPERSHQRVIRFAAPVYNEQEQFRGVIVIRQYLDDFLERLQIKDLSNDSKFMLLDSEGYWLTGPEEYPLFGFLFHDHEKLSFASYFPNTWKSMQESSFGYREADRGLFIFRELAIDEAVGVDNMLPATQVYGDDRNHWRLVVHVNYKDIRQLKSFEQTFWLVFGFVATLLLIASYIISRLLFKLRLNLNELNELNGTLERRIQARTDELSSQNEKLNQVNQELESFAYSVSHDLRAPLRHIAGFVDLLAKKDQHELSEKGLAYLGYIKQASRDMNRLIEDLLNFSRIGRAEIKGVEYEMDLQVLEVIRQLEKNSKGPEIDWQIGAMPKVFGDLSMIKQIWINLLGNAMKYSSKRDHPVINVTAKQEKTQIIFSVQDNGVGFDMKYRHKLFGPFQRLHSDEEYEGTGIGLAIVRRIVVRHGGTVWAEGQPEKGAIFYFSLPRKKKIKEEWN